MKVCVNLIDTDNSEFIASWDNYRKLKGQAPREETLYRSKTGTCFLKIREEIRVKKIPFDRLRFEMIEFEKALAWLEEKDMPLFQAALNNFQPINKEKVMINNIIDGSQKDVDDDLEATALYKAYAAATSFSAMMDVGDWFLDLQIPEEALLWYADAEIKSRDTMTEADDERWIQSCKTLDHDWSGLPDDMKIKLNEGGRY